MRAFQAMFFKLTEKAEAIAVRSLSSVTMAAILTVGNQRKAVFKEPASAHQACSF